jgi:hypothetical protein
MHKELQIDGKSKQRMHTTADMSANY